MHVRKFYLTLVWGFLKINHHAQNEREEMLEREGFTSQLQSFEVCSSALVKYHRDPCLLSEYECTIQESNRPQW